MKYKNSIYYVSRSITFIKRILKRINKEIPTELLNTDPIFKKYSNTSKATNKNNVIFLCDGSSIIGGFTDRIKGILTTYCECKINNRNFYLYWDNPFELSKFLVPNKYNWEIEKNDINFNLNSYPALIFQYSSSVYNLLKKILFRIWMVSKTKETHVISNLQMHIKQYPELFNELFKPSNFLQEKINYHLNKLGKSYHSFSFRFYELLGDFSDCMGQPLPKEKKELLIKKNINELKQIIEKYPKNKKILITSDSMTFLNNVKDLDDRIYIACRGTGHLEYDKISLKVWIDILIDFYLLMYAEKSILMITDKMYKSDFAKIASLIGKTGFSIHKF